MISYMIGNDIWMNEWVDRQQTEDTYEVIHKYNRGACRSIKEQHVGI